MCWCAGQCSPSACGSDSVLPAPQPLFCPCAGVPSHSNTAPHTASTGSLAGALTTRRRVNGFASLSVGLPLDPPLPDSALFFFFYVIAPPPSSPPFPHTPLFR